MGTKLISFLLFFAATAFVNKVNAQLYNYGQLYVDSGVVLYAKDTFQNNAAATLINKGTLSAAGAFINNAAINGKGKVVLSGTSNQNVSGTGTISNLEVNTAGAAVVPGNMQNITGTLTLTAGTLTANAGLSLKSTDSNTARVAPVTGGSVSGNVFVERYIPSRRAWRLITSPLSNANTINQAWQNGGVYTAAIGTFITGPGGGNGLDNGNSYSLKMYDAASQLLLPVISTNQSLSSANGSADNKGYFLFVRGDRNPANLTPPNTNITTLSSKGNLQTGTQSFTASAIANNFTLIGNPYASPVDFSSVTRNNLAKRFYAWDPSLNTVGGYVLVDDFYNTGTYSITPASSQTNILQSSQAFFVQTVILGTASIVFNESSKSSVTTNVGFRTGNGSNEVLKTSLYLKNTDTIILADGVLAQYNNNYSKDVNIEDATKIGNINENLAIARDGYLLSLERRPLIDDTDTLFLNLTNTTSRNYSFRFEPSNVSSVVAAWLEDAYLKTSTPISIASPTAVDFSMASNTPSANANRFRIVFKTSGVLPISAIELKAYEQNAGIAVNWSIAAESNMSNYEVEKSADGQSFKKVGSAAATGNNNTVASYNWFDAVPFSGNNFYRIKATGKSGEMRYSGIVNVKTGSAKAGIVVYPNPVENRAISLQFNNEPKGIYVAELFNALGQKLLTITIEHLGGSATRTIQLGALVSKGVYQLHISSDDNKITQQIIVQ